MYKGKSVGVVIPSYNEEGFVGEVIDTIPEFVDRVYVIDDCSTDGTWSEIQRYTVASDQPVNPPSPVADGGSFSEGRIVPIRHETNKGVGGAIKTGYTRARKDGIDVTAVMAGDGQMDPAQLDRLIDPIVEDNAGYAKGNRLLSRGYCEGMTTWRFSGNAILSFLTKFASGYWKTTDPQNGYTAISRRALTKLRLADLYDDYGFANDLLVHLNAHGICVADVAMPAVYGDEQSTIRYWILIPDLSQLLFRRFCWRLKTKYLMRDFHPLVFLYGIGTLGTGTSLLSGLYSLLKSSDSRVSRFWMSALTALISCLFLLLAMVFDMQESESLELQHRP